MNKKDRYSTSDLYEAYMAGQVHGYYSPATEQEYAEMKKREGYSTFNEWLKTFRE